MKINSLNGIIAAVLLAAGACSCTLRPLVVGETAAMVETGLAAFEEDDDLEMLARAFPANIKLLEALLASDPENARMLALLARLYAAYTFAFVEGPLVAAELAADDPARAAVLRQSVSRYYRLGADYALRALETRYPECRRQFRRPAAARRLMAAMDAADVPPLFWYAFNLGGWVNHNRDSVAAVARAHLAEAAMLRVVELAPSYYHGGAHLFLLVYYGSRPPMMGGSPEKARRHHQRLLAVAGSDFLLAEVYYARHLLPAAGERESFVRRLSAVAERPPGGDRYRLMNRVAADRARIYRNAVDRLFE